MTDIIRRRFIEYRNAAIRNGLTVDQFRAALNEYAAHEASDNGHDEPTPADWTSAALAVANASRFPRREWSGIVARVSQ